MTPCARCLAEGPCTCNGKASTSRDPARIAQEARYAQIMGDGRLRQAKALTEHLATAADAVRERRRLLAELRAEGVPMAVLASALGIARQRLYAILEERK